MITAHICASALTPVTITGTYAPRHAPRETARILGLSAKMLCLPPHQESAQIWVTYIWRFYFRELVIYDIIEFSTAPFGHGLDSYRILASMSLLISTLQGISPTLYSTNKRKPRGISVADIGRRVGFAGHSIDLLTFKDTVKDVGYLP